MINILSWCLQYLQVSNIELCNMFDLTYSRLSEFIAAETLILNLDYQLELEEHVDGRINVYSP